MPIAQINDPFLVDSHKMNYHPARVAAWAGARTIEEKLNVFPIYVEISPVGHCNHRCSFCAVDYIGYKNRALTTDTLYPCLDCMSRNGVKSVMFAGEGEPMLHPDIAEITNHACQAGLDVAFTTNGTALTKKFVDNALESVKWIKVSINGGSESYGLVHGCAQSTYDRVWNNLQYAVSKHEPCTIGAQCVVLPDNIGDITGIVRRARETGLRYIVLKPYSQHKFSNTHTYEEVSYQDQATQEAIKEAQSYQTDTFSVIARTNAMEDKAKGEHDYTKCSATPYFWAYIMATGDVYSCSAYLLQPEFCMGNINEESFASVWTGTKRRHHIAKMELLDISKCRLNCRMNQVNKYLNDVVNPNEHANFI